MEYLIYFNSFSMYLEYHSSIKCWKVASQNLCGLTYALHIVKAQRKHEFKEPQNFLMMMQTCLLKRNYKNQATTKHTFISFCVPIIYVKNKINPASLQFTLKRFCKVRILDQTNTFFFLWTECEKSIPNSGAAFIYQVLFFHQKESQWVHDREIRVRAELIMGVWV